VAAQELAMPGSAVIGSVAGSMNATVEGQSLLPHTTIFSGDSLQVRNGLAVIAVGNNSRVIFGRDTAASFLRDSNEVTVLLSQGNISIMHPTDGSAVRVKAGDFSISPAPDFKTLGDIAIRNGTVVVTARDGALQVENHGATKNVAKGQTIVLTPRTTDNKKGAGNAGRGGSGSTAFHVAFLGAAGTGAVLAGVAMSRAGSANINSLDAINAANAATSTAQSVLNALQELGCSLSQTNILNQCLYDLAKTGTETSPIALPPGTCPPAQFPCTLGGGPNPVSSH
jgi:hypothetical protein